MKTRAALLLAAATFAGSAAQAGYADLNRELEGYEPPALYRSQTAGKPGATGAARSASDAEFQAQAARVQELKTAWEKALSEPTTQVAAFYLPDASRLEALRPAATDAAAAEKALADGFTLETLETLVLLRSPAVQTKEAELRAAFEGFSQVEYLDAILRRYSVFTASLMAGIGGRENPDSVALKFPFPGVLALKGEVVNQDVRAVREELEAARRDAVTSVRKAYWELLYVRKAKETTGRMLDLLDNLKAAASARYSAGETSFQDVIKIGIEREKAKEELKTMYEDQRNMEADIRMVLNLAPGIAVGVPGAREPNREAVKEEALYPAIRERRQELRRMQAMIGRMELMLEMAETMIYPGFSLGLSTYERGEIARVGAGGAMAEGGGSFPVVTSASMGEGLPKMPWFGKEDAYLRETRQRITALKKDLEMTEASALLETHQAWFRLDKALREEALFGDRVVSLSQAALESSTRGYAAGKVMFSDLIESYTGWLEANLALERARADAGIGRAELEAAVGTTALGH